MITVKLSTREIELLAGAIEAHAAAHDKQLGSCPADLFQDMQRAEELRSLLLPAPAAAPPTDNVVTFPGSSTVDRHHG